MDNSHCVRRNILEVNALIIFERNVLSLHVCVSLLYLADFFDVDWLQHVCVFLVLKY